MFAFLHAYLTFLAQRPDPARPDAPPEQGSPTFATAARRAMLLYVPFRDFHTLTDVGQALHPNTRPERYDINCHDGKTKIPKTKEEPQAVQVGIKGRSGHKARQG